MSIWLSALNQLKAFIFMRDWPTLHHMPSFSGPLITVRKGGVLVLAYTINPKEGDIQYIANLADQFGITVVGAQQFEALQALTEELGVSRREVAIPT